MMEGVYELLEELYGFFNSEFYSFSTRVIVNAFVVFFEPFRSFNVQARKFSAGHGSPSLFESLDEGVNF